jgi:hypothetical protein
MSLETPLKSSNSASASAAVGAIAVPARKSRRTGAGLASLGGPAVYPLHPFLLAAASIFVPYADNLRELVFSDVAIPLVTVLIVALGLYLASATLLRTFGPPAAVFASIPLIAGIHYMDIVDLLSRWTGGAIHSANALPLILGVAAILMLAVALLHLNLTLPNAILNGIAIVLFITPAWKVSRYVWGTVSRAESRGPDIAGGSSAPGPLPDIYYFIFDRYASEGTLKREFGYDNSEFIDFLKDEGFYVASKSRANYLKTAPSIASTINLDYINALHGDPSTARGDWRPIYGMLDDHRVGRFVKDHGYKFIQIGGWWGPTQHSKVADEAYSFGFSEFSWLYLRRTILPPLADTALPGTETQKLLDWDNSQCHRVPLQFQKIKEIGRMPGPTFTFSHILLPHEPLVFRPDGSCRPAAETGKITYEDGYVGQLQYANTMIRDMVTDLLATDGPPPIIILQADEGPFPERYRTTPASWDVATDRELQMKTGILNAIYLPDGDYQGFSQDMTSVNTFRLVFDKLFGTKLGLLPDRIYAFPDVFHLYDFYDITERSRAP